MRPNAQGVACRLLILAFVAGKAVATPPPEVWREMNAKLPEEDRKRLADEIDGRSRRLCEVLRRSGLWEFMTSEECSFAEVSIQEMKEEQQINLSWAVEAAACLLWALNMTAELPSPDEEADPTLLKLVPLTDLKRFIDDARLRPQNELEEARDLAELWHWRSRTRELWESGTAPAEDEQLHRLGVRSYDDIVRMTSKMAKEKGLLSAVIDEDFPACGKAYRELSAEEWSEVRSISFERHRALNWLCGFAPGGDWSRTPTDT